MNRTFRVVALALAVAILSAGCGFQGINSLPLPGTQGTADGSYQIDVALRDVINIVPNTPVRLDDLAVGSTKDIRLEGYTAVVTVALNPGVVLPANATVKTAQTSLLGAKHLEFGPPLLGQPPLGRLQDGDRIPLERTDGFPDTEKVLATVAMFLNGSGLQQIRTITTELNRAVGGREPEVREALTNLARFTDGLNRQRGDIVRAIEGLNRLSETVGRQRGVVEDALEVAPPALAVLNDNRRELVGTFQSLARFGDTANAVIDKSQRDLVGNLQDLQPALRGLADSGESLARSLRLLPTVIFPTDGIRRFFQGDYANLFANVDATLGSLDRNLLTGTPLSGVLAGAQGVIGGGSQAGNPLNNLVPGRRGGN